MSKLLLLLLSLFCLARSRRRSQTLLFVVAAAELRRQDGAMERPMSASASVMEKGTPPGDRQRSMDNNVQHHPTKDESSAMGVMQRSQRSVAEENIPNDHPSTFMEDRQQLLEQNDDKDQCQGMYMAMFMDGFHWSSTACLNFFVSSWKLTPSDSGACIFSCLLAVLMESLLAARLFLLRRAPDRYGLLMAVYLCQALLGYLLMLIAMTFSAPLMGALIIGLVVGNYLFAPSVGGVDETTRSSSADRGNVAMSRPTSAAAAATNGSVVQQTVPGNPSSAGSSTLRRRG
jgi:hypothetical protein